MVLLCFALLATAGGAKAPAAATQFLQRFAEFFPAETTDFTRLPAAVLRAPVQAGKARLPSGIRPPIAEVTLVVNAPDGTVWLGSNSGAMRCRPKSAERCDYFAGRRYLLDDEVQAIYPESRRHVWIRTRTGVSRLEFRPMDLEQKTGIFEEIIRLRHNRYGLVATSELARPGDLSSNRMVPNDNDGLWTAIFVGAESFRYAATRHPEARRLARESMGALMRLEEITGIPGFPARAYIERGDYRHSGGEWHFTPDGRFEWKGDTSSDEIVGHFLAYSLYYDLVADEAEKPALRAAVARITDHILGNGRYLLDVDGKPTTWGRWSLEYFQSKPPAGIGFCDSPLNSLELLSFVKTAHHITGEPRFAQAYAGLVAEGYARTAALYLERRCEINYSDEELAMLSFFPLLEYEHDPHLRKIYLTALEQWWENIRRERSSLWIYIHNRATGRRDNLEEARRTLERWPIDLRSWTVRNSHRSDMRPSTGKDRFDQPEFLDLLPPDERPVMRWNANPFRVDGGNGGRSEDDGAAFLLPYWMARYYRYLKK